MLGCLGVSGTNQCSGYCASTNESIYKCNLDLGVYHKHVTEPGCDVYCGNLEPLVLVPSVSISDSCIKAPDVNGPAAE